MLITEHLTRVTLFTQPEAPRTAFQVLDEMDRLIRVQTDRIAAEDAAWWRAPAHRRRYDAGHRCLVVDRPAGPAVVPLADLTEAEMGAVG